DAKMMKTKVSANIIQQTTDNKQPTTIPNFSVIGSVTVFDGWLAADTDAQGEEIQIPKISENESLKLLNIDSQDKQTEPPGRYTEAGLVKELEKREIGRPSTYASIIKTINDRGYVVKEGKTLHPTDTGEVVSDFLENNFAEYISDSFTAEMENKLDEIAEGKREYEKMLKDFYGPFSKEIKIKDKTTEKLTNLGEADAKFKCPICSGPMVIKLSKNGKFLSCKKFPDCMGARKMDGTEMEGPKETGEICPECKTGKLIEREGKFGKFISCNNYPKCKFIKTSPEEEAKKKTGVKCPECISRSKTTNASESTNNENVGEIVERRGRFGLFYSCSNYPKCKFAIKARPTGKVCDFCGSLMMEGTKTIPERCSNKACKNHNPHKLK
ncbi:MAG: topoisomerase protein, partial [Parcubacteria group bacterium GW2011_GWE2_37_8]